MKKKLKFIYSKMKKKNQPKVFPLLKHIFSQNNSNSIQKNNLLLNRVLKYYPNSLEALDAKALEIEVDQIISLIEKNWIIDENKELIFNLFVFEFIKLIKSENSRNSLQFLCKFFELVQIDIKKLPKETKTKIPTFLKDLLRKFLKIITKIQYHNKIKKIQKIVNKAKNKEEEIFNEKSSEFKEGVVQIKDKEIPKLDLGLTKGHFSNLLASRSTRRAQVSYSMRKIQNGKRHVSINNLNTIANSLGKCFISGEVVWFLRSKRERFLEKFAYSDIPNNLENEAMFETEKNSLKHDLYASIINSIPDIKKSDILNTEKLRSLKDEEIDDNIYIIRRNNYSSHKIKDQKEMPKSYSNVYSSNNIEKNNHISKDSQLIDIYLNIFQLLKTYIKEELIIIREILFNKIFVLNKKDISSVMIRFIFEEEKYLKKINNILCFNSNDVKKNQKCLEIIILLLHNNFKVLNSLGSSILASRGNILAKRGPLFKKIQFTFINFLLVLIESNPEHYFYFSNFLLKNENFLFLLEHEIRNMLIKGYDKKIIKIYFKLLLKLINEKNKYKAIIEYFSGILNVKRKNQNESDDYILGIVLKNKIQKVLKGKINKEIFNLLKILKALLKNCGDGLLKCYYLRIVYIAFLKIYSSFSDFYKKNDYVVMNKLLSIILVIIFDKKNEDISSILRQLKIINFMGKEVDLEFEINFKKILIESQKDSVVNLKNEFIPKLNFANLVETKPKKNIFNLDLDKIETNTKNEMNQGNYLKERKLRKIYFDDKLHKKMIEVLLCLLLSNCTYSLEEEFTGVYPIQAGKLNYLYILQKHVLHKDNKNFILNMMEKLEEKISSLIFLEKNEEYLEPYNEKFKKVLENSETFKQTKTKNENSFNSSCENENHFETEKQSKREINIYKGMFRLLKLLGLKANQKYLIKGMLGIGAYSTVYECSLKNSEGNFAIKIIEADKNIYERNALYFLFNEVSVLENLITNTNSDNNLLKMYDYGVTENNDFFILFPKLQKISKTIKNPIKSLSVFYKVCKDLEIIHGLQITHYDIKADNIMMNKKGPIIVDYGESLQNEQNFRIRGTECIKSPEMLLSGLEKFEFDQVQGINKYKEMINLYNRQSKFNIGSSCDVWSLGCLLYELYTGNFLFHDQDWSKVFNKITSDSFNIFNEEFLKNLDDNIFLIEIIKYILNRNPQHRPSVKNICKKLNAVFKILNYDIRNENFYNANDFKNQETFEKEKTNLQFRREDVLSGNFGIINGFWLFSFLGINWDPNNASKKTEIPFFKLQNEFELENLCLFYLNNPNDEKQFLNFYFLLQNEFFKFLKYLKISIKEKKKFLVYTETGLIGILFSILIFQLRQVELITILDLIKIQHISLNSFNITNRLYNFIIKICEKQNKFFKKFLNLKTLSCICGNQSFLVLKDEALKKRICECSDEKKNFIDWECDFKHCNEYKLFLEKRFNYKIHDLVWYHLPINNILGISRDYSRFFDSDFNIFFETWNKNNHFLSIDKSQPLNFIYCKKCSFLTIIINNKDNTVLFLERFLQVFEINSFFFNI